MAKERYSSSSRIFERRGDPWLSDRERVRDYNRDPDAEDPEYDYSHRFHHSQNAVGKPREAPPRPEVPTPEGKARERDYALRGAQILAKHNRGRARITEARELPQRFAPCADCRKAVCFSQEKCAFPFGRK